MKIKSYLFLVSLLILSSCKLKEDTVTNPTEPTPSETTLTISSPNGGESLDAGNQYDIKWTSNTTALVNIEYTVNNGGTWTLIADSVENTGVYTWFPIPNKISTQCKIRVSTVNGVKADDSDSPFSIVSGSTQKVVVTMPNGGENIEAGSQETITWSSSNIDSVRIEYTIDNGNHWNLIAIDKNNTGSYYWDPVPTTPSTLGKIRIMDAKDGNPVDESDSTFNIVTQPGIKVLSPKGGESLISGSGTNITWSSLNVENVKIEYTTNAGANWNLIVSSTPSTGSYVWENIPAVTSNQCRIRISDAVDGDPFGISDNNFSISSQLGQNISVTSPNGGEEWVAGSRQVITWDAEGILNVNLEYTTNNGTTWNTIATNVTSTGSYTWDKIPTVQSTNCKVRVSDAVDAIPIDVSDGSFSIIPEPAISVTSPNGGETVQAGDNYTIKWVSSNIPAVKIEFTTDGGGNWQTIIASTPSTGEYVWAVAQGLNSSQCKVRVSDASDGNPFDISDNNFKITNQVTKSLELISPNGGEEWEAGSQQNITWNSVAVTNVKIELTTDKGLNWTTLVPSIASSGAYQWKLDTKLNSPQCKIRISDVDDATLSSVSNSTFTIKPIQSITVLEPHGGVNYKAGNPITITWESSGIDHVGIKYTITNGQIRGDTPDFYVLVSSIANTGSYTTSFSLPSSEYYVVVYDADDNTPSARSIGNFTILKQETPSVTLLYPNGGEQWLGNEKNVSVTDVQKYHPYEITWNSENVKKVKIEWTTNGGGDWYVVPGADSTESDGSFIWAPGRLDSAVPDSSDNCRIRISSADEGASAFDLTDGFFSIHKSKKIRLLQPNGGQFYYMTADEMADPKPSNHWPMTITWTSYAVSGNVTIWYSLQNGADGTWQQLVTTPSTGAYGWDFVFGPVQVATPSSLVRLKIVDAADGSVWDVNDAPVNLNLIGEN